MYFFLGQHIFKHMYMYLITLVSIIAKVTMIPININFYHIVDILFFKNLLESLAIQNKLQLK